jgi:predicted CXXCH cytochrome family protein
MLGALPLFGQQYTGSTACKTCHPQVYARWSKTRMANVVRDPKEHPEAIIPDLSKADPVVTFTKNDIAFVYGSKWKQRYFTKVGNDYFPLGAQWDVAHQKWSAYQVRAGTDWWAAFYPADNMKRPTGPLCDGCHSVNYNVQTNSVTEWNVGCERCHGPGSEHVRQPAVSNIVNPAKLSSMAASDTCIQCHSQGKPLTNPINGKYYDWPVGFQMGKNLSDFWQLEEHKLGETTFTHFGEDTAHKNRMQGNDFVQSVMYTRGVKCSSCHDVHGTENNADTIKPGAQMCLECHSPTSPNGPHAATLQEHSHHKAGSAGDNCLECHMPKIAQTMPDDFVRSHTFRFITPTMTEQYAIPNACTSCHKDKTTAWAKEALKGWRNQSPWRVAP